jgi:CRISPR-associated protein Csx3
MPITFHTTLQTHLAVLHFAIDGILQPAELRNLQPPDPVREDFAHLGVVLSGRGPVWLYGFLVHFYHPCRFVAIYDPRLQGAVVVDSHAPEIQPGEIIPI